MCAPAKLSDALSARHLASGVANKVFQDTSASFCRAKPALTRAVIRRIAAQRAAADRPQQDAPGIPDWLRTAADDAAVAATLVDHVLTEEAGLQLMRGMVQRLRTYVANLTLDLEEWQMALDVAEDAAARRAARDGPQPDQ